MLTAIAIVIVSVDFSITGLDPAAPLYLKSSHDAIKPSDAPFVDISKYTSTEH